MLLAPPLTNPKVVLHSCCAPCSSAIVEVLLQNNIRPIIFFFNPNIFPIEEYIIRKNEAKRYANQLGLEYIDGDYNHQQWREDIKGLENEPERGKRCSECFVLRMRETARITKEVGCNLFTTTLASSRWKNLDQIFLAGNKAAELFDGVSFWEQNWRKGGLQQRRNEIIKELNFYNQTYCGCEFSLASSLKRQKEIEELASKS